MTESVIAVDLGGTKVAAASVTSRGTIRHRIREDVDISTADAPVEQIVRISRSIASLDGSVTRLGIAVPGLVRRDGGVWAPNLPGWERIPLAQRLRRRMRMPVTVESDRNAVVLGEAWRGAARGKSDVIVLIIGTGIGAGILSDGRLIRGAHELSGCAGWLVVTDIENENTASKGSLEALAAGAALGRGQLSAAQVAEAARRGDREARERFRRAGHLLGLAVANMISLFDPEVVVLAGGLVGSGDLFFEELRRAVLQRAQPLSAPQVQIVVSALGTDANLLGAAFAALHGPDRSHS